MPYQIAKNQIEKTVLSFRDFDIISSDPPFEEVHRCNQACKPLIERSNKITATGTVSLINKLSIIYYLSLEWFKLNILV